ncbi:hypothetical protein I4U23_017566 [Adineta vaga]|nr:hypothetical protein I4U23_017566 [Adineta vaga]
MSLSMACSRLVLFDCDNDRLSLFTDHDTLISQIPSNCEYHLHWDDSKLFMVSILDSFVSKRSNIRLKPSYDSQSKTDVNKKLIKDLDDHVNVFRFILLVHGREQNYRPVLDRIAKEYGQYKMELFPIDPPFHQYLEKIIIAVKNEQLQMPVFNEYRNNQKFSSSLVDSLRSYDATEAYVTEWTAIKQLTKKEQRNLTADYNDMHYGDTSQLDTTNVFDDEDEELVFDYRLALNNSETQPSKPDTGSARSCSSSQYPNTKYAPSIPSMNQADRILSCLKCSRKFRCICDLLCHCDASHDNFDYASLINSATLPLTSKLFMGTSSNKKKIKNISGKRQFVCAQCSITFHVFVKPNGYNAIRFILSNFSSNSKLLVSNQNQMNAIQKSSENVKQKPLIPSAQAQKVVHINNVTKSLTNNYFRSTAFKTTTSISSPINSLVDIKCPFNTKETNSTKSKPFSCWQCTKKFESVGGRLNHFINKHATLFQYKATLAKQLYNPNIKITTNSHKQCYCCWNCSKTFECFPTVLSHFVSKHAVSLLRSEHDPSSLLENEIFKAQEKSNNGKSTICPTTNVFSYSHCTQPEKSVNDHRSHFIGECILPGPAISITTSIPSYSQVVATQAAVENTISLNSFKQNPKRCSYCPKTFKSSGACKSHTESKHSKSIASDSAKATSSLNSPATSVQNTLTTTKPAATFVAQSVSCSYCSKTFKSPSACESHTKAKHSVCKATCKLYHSRTFKPSSAYKNDVNVELSKVVSSKSAASSSLLNHQMAEIQKYSGYTEYVPNSTHQAYYYWCWSQSFGCDYTFEKLFQY